MARKYPTIAQLKTAELFRNHIAELGINLPFDETLQSGDESPLAQPRTLKTGREIGNRFAIQPMEGWDGTLDGMPSEHTIRRWKNFGRSGAKLIWGGEAVAVRHDGRANPNQLLMNEANLSGFETLRDTLLQAHRDDFGATDDLLIGLQLTHSGRFCKPNSTKKMEPMILYHHPPVEKIYNTDPELPVFTDDEIEALIEDYVIAAKYAYELGFEFVDLKHCHGYLGHEFLSAYSRPGKYGGSFENRTRFLREMVEKIRAAVPGLLLGVRVSIIDFPPYREGEDGISRPVTYRNGSEKYPYAFGGNPDDADEVDLKEPIAFLELLRSLDIELVNLTVGSPYYNPHVTRPAMFPPSDGYAPPEDPLIGVARHINTVAALKADFPDLAIVGSGYSYLQDWLPNVAQNVVRAGQVDFVGLGRMVLTYPDMPADVLRGNDLRRKSVCRTFSDCTTGPRNGMISGCFPLDDYYKALPEADAVKAVKQSMKS